MFSPWNGAGLDFGWGLAWLAVGLIFGGLATSLIGRGGYGVVGDGMILSVALIAGLLFDAFGGEIAWIAGGMAVACLGACVVIGWRRFGIRKRPCSPAMALRRAAVPEH